MAQIAVIGGGPAGLMAAELLAAHGQSVTLFEAMPSFGRKLLMAGKSGLNLTHGEPHAALRARYGAASARLGPALDGFTAHDIEAWCAGLGVKTFIGSSGRVFPEAMKASPLLRAWLARLAGLGVRFRPRHRWLGFDGTHWRFATPSGDWRAPFAAGVLALGGASWPRLGADGAWTDILRQRGVELSPWQPANCGFETAWSAHFAGRWAGAPIKAVSARSAAGTILGELMVTGWGIEGGLVYAHAASLRAALAEDGAASLSLDLAPHRSLARLTEDLARQPAKLSLANRLRKGAGLEGVKAALVRECVPEAGGLAAAALATTLKTLALPVIRPRPLAEAISAAGGVALSEIDDAFMLKRLPGVFLAGEMLDWEAPTGGYLLTACLATGRAAARGVLDFLEVSTQPG